MRATEPPLDGHKWTLGAALVAGAPLMRSHLVTSGLDEETEQRRRRRAVGCGSWLLRNDGLTKPVELEQKRK